MKEHNAIDLYPDPPPPKKQCEALRSGTYSSDNSGTKYRCKHNATFIIDGVHLCRKHAGSRALEILLENSP